MTKTTTTNAGPRREAAEFVLPGHPDKLCDAAVDAVVDYVRRWDPVGQCGLEAGCIFDRFFMTGRIAVRDIRIAERLLDGELHRLVRGAYASKGGKLFNCLSSTYAKRGERREHRLIPRGVSF